MERISGDKKVQLLEEFTKDTGLKLCVGNRTQYTEWLEYRLVKKLPIQRVSKGEAELLIAFAHKWNDCDAPLIEDEYVYDYLEGNL